MECEQVSCGLAVPPRWKTLPFHRDHTAEQMDLSNVDVYYCYRAGSENCCYWRLENGLSFEICPVIGKHWLKLERMRRLTRLESEELTLLIRYILAVFLKDIELIFGNNNIQCSNLDQEAFFSLLFI